MNGWKKQITISTSSVLTCEEDKDCWKGKENLLQKKMSSSPLASSLFFSLSTLSAHKHGRSWNFCVSRKEQCLRVRAAKLPEGVNPLFYFPTNQYLKTKQTACCVVINIIVFVGDSAKSTAQVSTSVSGIHTNSWDMEL